MIGIVAARLVETHNRPVVLIALDGGRGRGSGRSIGAFDLLGALNACSEHLIGHGGHRAAAGLEIDGACVEAFAQALAAHADSVLAPGDLAPVEHVDAVVGGEELGMELAEELQSLAPFGRGNPGVSLMVKDATFSDARAMGEGKHVRFTVHSGRARARAVAFGTAGKLPVADGEPVRATFKLEVNEWRGVCEPRLVLRHALAVPMEIEAARLPPAQQPAPAAADEANEHELVLFALP